MVNDRKEGKWMIAKKKKRKETDYKRSEILKINITMTKEGKKETENEK